MKVIYPLICLLFFGTLSYAQCVPDSGITHNVPGIYPSAAIGLPHAITGQPYSTVIQVFVRPDTTIGIFHVIIDSVNVENVVGLPPGFTYSCTPSNCSFPGGTNGCIFLQGQAPSNQMAGTYPLVVRLKEYGTLSGTPLNQLDSSTDYSIVVDSTTGIGTLEKSNFSAGQNLPNPAKESTIIPVMLVHPEIVSLTVSNIIGKKVIFQTYNLQKGKTNIQLDIHGLQPGIYLYTISNGTNTITRRMIVSND